MAPTRPLRFGIFPSPAAAAFRDTLSQVQLADQLGLDLVGVQDHPYQRRFLDTFALITTMLATTDRITVFPDVANLPLRGAAIIAKTSASLDIMFPGRFILGLGAGSFWEAVEGLGGPRRPPAEAVDAFVEAVTVIRALWSGERGIHREGDHYWLSGTHSGPVPVSDIGIWSGAGGPRMLDITGRICDGWVPSSPYVPPEHLAQRHRLIDEGALAAGRDPSDIVRVYNIVGRIAAEPGEGFLHGNRDQWIAQLSELVSVNRMEGFVLMLDEEPEEQIRAFSEIAAWMRANDPR